MGSAPCPQVRRYRYSGSRTQSEGRKLFGSPQAPYLRWCVFGSCPSPRVFMGSTPCPQDETLTLFGGMPALGFAASLCEEPQSKDASYSEGSEPHISDGVYLGEAQAPGCLLGVPHTPKSDAAAIREDARTPNFQLPFFNFQHQ